MNAGMVAWLSTRPESVQKLAREFPIGSVFQPLLPGEDLWYLIGYTEDDMLIVSRVDPEDDDEAARETAFCVCAAHYRDPS